MTPSERSLKVSPFHFRWPRRRRLRFLTWRTDRVFRGGPPPSIRDNPQRVFRLDVGSHSFGILVKVKP